MFETLFNQSIQVNPTNIYIHQGIVGQWFKSVLGLNVSRAPNMPSMPNMPNMLQRKPDPSVSANSQEEGHATCHVPENPKDGEADLPRAGLFQLSYGAVSSPAP